MTLYRGSVALFHVYLRHPEWFSVAVATVAAIMLVFLAGLLTGVPMMDYD